MTESEINEILQGIEKYLSGDAEHDADVLLECGERYRNKPGSEPLLSEISKRLFALMTEADAEEAQEIFEDIAADADGIFREALDLIDRGKIDEALAKLQMLTEIIGTYPLSHDVVWTDFTSYLEALVYQDYYGPHIRGREIVRHPMHPGPILFTCGSLLIDTGRFEEALKPLRMLNELDPVCPKYIFELGEVYKRTRHFNDAYDNALWGLSCAVNRAELARCYRDLAYCLSETGRYEDAVMLYLLSLRFHPSRQADAEIAWIHKKAGVNAEAFDEQMILDRCKELHIPVGLSETVQQNIAFLKSLGPQNEESDKEA